jgi:hypothetical protein
MRCKLDLEAEGVSIIPIGGAHAVRGALSLVLSECQQVRLAGLCDAQEERYFQRGLEWVGLGSNLDRAAMETLGFFVCVPDLEAELIHSLGVSAVEAVIQDQGELSSFRKFQKQPAHRSGKPEEQLRYFMSTRSGRKANYARSLVDALDLTKVPRPMQLLLAYVRGSS